MTNPPQRRAQELVAQAVRPSLMDAMWAESAPRPSSDSTPLEVMACWNVASILVDDASEFVYLNPAAQSMTGYKVADMAYHAPLSTWLWRHHEDPLLAPGSVCSDGSVWRGTTSLKAQDGVDLVAQCTVYPLCDASENVVGMVIVLHDRTQQFQRARLAGMSTLSGRIAHDLNNLLTIQAAYSQMLVEDLCQGTEAHEEATQVLRSVRRMMDLSRKLMMASGRIEPLPTPVDIGQLAAAIGQEFAEGAPQDVELVVSTAPEPLVVNANEMDIEAMLGELIQNALDAVGVAGSVAITVRRCEIREPAESLDAGAYALIAVSDSGPGLALDMLDHLYEPLYAHKRGGVGTGLGLAVARGVAIAHGGLLRLVKNPAGHGARFEVLLPMVD